MPRKKDPPTEVVRIRNEITAFFKTRDPEGRTIGSAKCGVYAFYDYDGEPIYVGQTVEGLSGRVSRHLTGRRSDAVAKFVLDPFEVLDIEVWPMFWLPGNEKPTPEMKAEVNAMEYAVFQEALYESKFRAVLNEGVIAPAAEIEVGNPYRGRIIPDDLYVERRHPDIRIARRAATIANLTRLISERVVQKGLRTTLLVQSQRLEWLARARLEDFANEPDEVERDS